MDNKRPYNRVCAWDKKIFDYTPKKYYPNILKVIRRE